MDEADLKSLCQGLAFGIAGDIEDDLSKMTATVADENNELHEVPYTVDIVEGDDGSIVIEPTFDNSVDEYSNSLLIAKHGFTGKATLTQVLNRIVS